MQKAISFLTNIAFVYLWIGVLISSFKILSWLFWGIPKTIFVQIPNAFAAWEGFFGFLIAFFAGSFFQLTVDPLFAIFFWGFEFAQVFLTDMPFWKILFPGFYDLLFYMEK